MSLTKLKSTIMSKRTIWLLIPLIPYLIPMMLGLAWLPIGNESLHLTGNPYPYDYIGKRQLISPSADPETSTHYTIPYFHQLRKYLREGTLPLWNTNAGLGLPFAAMGEGSPYSPVSILRSFIPAHFHDLVSVLNFFIGSIFFFLLLKEMGIEEKFSLISTAIYTLQGAFTTTILIPNIAQTITLFPLIFWSCMKVINGTCRHSFLLFVSTLIFFMISGHVQHAFIGMLLLTLFQDREHGNHSS